jgi:hypothetical protein
LTVRVPNFETSLPGPRNGRPEVVPCTWRSCRLPYNQALSAHYVWRPRLGSATASIYGVSEGLRTLIVEMVTVGGQAGTSSRTENHLGLPTGISGHNLAERAIVQAEKFGAYLTSPYAVSCRQRQSREHGCWRSGPREEHAPVPCRSNGGTPRNRRARELAGDRVLGDRALDSALGRCHFQGNI